MLEALKMAGTSRLMSVMRTLASTEDPLFSQATTSADTDEPLRWGAGWRWWTAAASATGRYSFRSSVTGLFAETALQDPSPA
jgi:hypothetical protein